MAQEQEIRKLADLTPDSNNYNKGTEKGRKLIGKSLKKLGAGRSILIDKDGNVIAGNKTLEGAAAAGIDEVIVVKTTGRQIVAVQRTDLEIGSKKGREMALADNATGAANLSWDLEAMTADGWTESDLSGWGVGMPEAEPVKTEAFEDDFEPPAEIEEIQTDIVAGDLFEIGEHRLLCGDSTKAEDVERLMGGEKADMEILDPLFDMDYMQINSTKPGVICIFGRGSKAFQFIADLCESGYGYHNLVNLTPANGVAEETLPANTHEIIHVLRKVKAFDHQHALQYCKTNGDLRATSVMNFGRPTTGEGYFKYAKPIGEVSYLFAYCPKKGICVDLFCGSGTTMVAAHQLNRRCFGMEISPKYCQVILDRMIKLDPNIEIKKNGEPYNNR